MTARSLPVAAITLAATLFWFSGCGGDGVSLVPVTGVVRLNGQPLEWAAVVFTPAAENAEGPPGNDWPTWGMNSLARKASPDSEIRLSCQLNIESVTRVRFLNRPRAHDVSSNQWRDVNSAADPSAVGVDLLWGRTGSPKRPDCADGRTANSGAMPPRGSLHEGSLRIADDLSCRCAAP